MTPWTCIVAASAHTGKVISHAARRSLERERQPAAHRLHDVVDGVDGDVGAMDLVEQTDVARFGDRDLRCCSTRLPACSGPLTNRRLELRVDGGHDYPRCAAKSCQSLGLCTL